MNKSGSAQALLGASLRPLTFVFRMFLCSRGMESPQLSPAWGFISINSEENII